MTSSQCQIYRTYSVGHKTRRQTLILELFRASDSHWTIWFYLKSILHPDICYQVNLLIPVINFQSLPKKVLFVLDVFVFNNWKRDKKKKNPLQLHVIKPARNVLENWWILSSLLLIVVRQEFSKTRLFSTSTHAVTWTTTGNKELTDSNRKMAREPTDTCTHAGRSSSVKYLPS